MVTGYLNLDYFGCIDMRKSTFGISFMYEADSFNPYSNSYIRRTHQGYLVWIIFYYKKRIIIVKIDYLENY